METPAQAPRAKDPARAPHRATRRLIEREGHDAPRLLYLAFDAFNARFFAGRLGAPLILIAETSSPRAVGDYTPRDIHGLQSRIRIAPRMLGPSMRYALATLLHEMVHAWQSEIAHDMEEGYKSHGPRFASMANEIGGALGFPECAPKGRGGKARAETWPDLPPGEDTPQSKRRAKTPTSDPAGEDLDAPEADETPDADARTGALDERSRVVRFLADIAAHYRSGGKPKTAKTVQRLALEIERGAHLEET